MRVDESPEIPGWSIEEVAGIEVSSENVLESLAVRGASFADE